MPILRSFLGLAILFTSLSTLVSAAAMVNIPRGLRQTDRGVVVERMKLIPDGSWTAQKSRRSSTPPPCTPGSTTGAGTCQCGYTVLCQTRVLGGTIVGSTIASTFSDCLNSCDSVNNCFSVDWEYSTETCTFYLDSAPATVTNANYDLATYDGGNCAGTC